MRNRYNLLHLFIMFTCLFAVRVSQMNSDIKLHERVVASWAYRIAHVCYSLAIKPIRHSALRCIFRSSTSNTESKYSIEKLDEIFSLLLCAELFLNIYQFLQMHIYVNHDEVPYSSVFTSSWWTEIALNARVSTTFIKYTVYSNKPTKYNCIYITCRL